MNSQEKIYVAYLPLPRALRVWITAAAIGMVMLMLLFATTLATWQNDPGDGVWNTDEIMSLQGVIPREGYPLLFAMDPQNPGKTIPVIPVLEGKHGAAQLLAPWRGKAVRMSGYPLQRGSLRMLELQDDSNPITEIKEIDDAMKNLISSVLNSPLPATKSTGKQIVLQGEIIDPKCWSGAMKPGEGKTHKACASLCIRGGIPPVFLQHSPGNSSKIFLIARPDGEMLSDDDLEKILPFVGEQVRASAQIQIRNGMEMLLLESTSLVRP